MPGSDKSSHLKSAAEALLACAQNTLQKGGSLVFSQDPEIKEREIIEYDSRMRVFGLQKFDGLCYISAINFYRNEQDLKNHNTIGTLILFLEDEGAGRFLKTMGYRDFDEDIDDSLLEKLGQFCKVLAEDYKKELAKLGYGDPVMSEPANFKNDVATGVEFPYEQYQFYELNFYFWKKKTIVLNIVLVPPV